jgi:hypothetical protein
MLTIPIEDPACALRAQYTHMRELKRYVRVETKMGATNNGRVTMSAADGFICMLKCIGTG